MLSFKVRLHMVTCESEINVISMKDFGIIIEKKKNLYYENNNHNNIGKSQCINIR